MANTLANRTHTCGALRVEHEGQEVILKGWITLRREHKNIIFLDLGDRYGMTQLTLNTQEYPQLATLLPELRLGTCIGVAGTVVDREKSGGSVNKQLETGAIEVIVSHAEIYGATKDLPFPIKDEIDASDLTRLKYRYLDLRRNPIARNIQLRSKVTHAIRDYMHSQEFLEIETPILMKSTPEGARDYLVPSREEPGHFYALPQSPQLYKQLLMIAGMDKYYQIARCFRDEDLRADRQPEFTQIDLEMSFVRDKDVHNVVEGMFVHIFREAMNIELTTPFPRMTYKEAMERFGEDKPDLRYGLELIDMTSVFAESGFGAFSGKCVKGIRVPNEAGRSKSWIKKLEKFIKQRGAGGLAWFKKLDNSWESSIKYFLGDGSAELEAIEQITEAQNNDLLFVVAHEKASSVNEWLSALRRKLAETLELIDSSKYSFLWIDEFPLVEETEDENGVKQLHMLHHPFTQPHPEDIDKIETSPADIRSISYDLVLNGYELGSGSLRVFDTELQTRLLKMVGIEQEEAEERFGFFLEALKYGTPPHGGMGLGLDRIIMILAGSDTLRDVIAFPKTQKAACPMSEAPGSVDQQQLDDVHITLAKEDKAEE